MQGKLLIPRVLEVELVKAIQPDPPMLNRLLRQEVVNPRVTNRQIPTPPMRLLKRTLSKTMEQLLIVRAAMMKIPLEEVRRAKKLLQKRRWR